MPPFVPTDDMGDLDRIAALGMNVIRLPFIWEAYEPTRGIFQTSYLNKMVSIAQAATERGLYVVVDFHQDGFSRWSISGCGSGFPRWATPVGVTLVLPNNSEAQCADWGAKMFLDTGMHTSFSAFHSDREGAKGSFLEMVRRSVAAFSTVRGVIGYDLLNEPWGTDAELSALYDAEGAVIRQEAPKAILFVEAHITTNAGLGSSLKRPAFDNMAYAPHYYTPLTMLQKSYDGNPSGIDDAFEVMEGKAAEWGVPLFVGEFGMFAEAVRARDYVVREYEDLDRHFASGSQWNISPRWTPEARDGWNGEDLSIVDPRTGAARANFRVQPFLRATAGKPKLFRFNETEDMRVEVRWQHEPGLGATEIVLPRLAFPPSAKVLSVGVTCSRSGSVLSCTGGQSGEAIVAVE
jgi:endoglycosylceramidase